jgi:hypothetical protein
MALALELEICADVGCKVFTRCGNQACGLNKASSLPFWVGKSYRFARKKLSRKQRMSFPSVWDVFPGSSVDCEAKQPPRHASAEPEAPHVACFCADIGVPRFDPRPERKRGRGSKRGG